jgi:VCBS repeat-containing protein
VDVLVGGATNTLHTNTTMLVGGNGGDVLVDGSAKDVFLYRATTESSYVKGGPIAVDTTSTATESKTASNAWDIIVNFNSGKASGTDKIDLHLLDQQLSGNGPTELVWVASTANDTDAIAGQANAAHAHGVWTDANGNFLYADTNGDGVADLKIQVSGVTADSFNGVDHAPVVVGGTFAGAVTELPNVTNSPATDSTGGTINFADADTADTHHATFQAEGTGYVGNFFFPTGSFADSTGGVKGSQGWTFSVTDSAIDFLGAGEHLTQKYDVSITDNFGASVTQVVTVTINGSIDAPTLSASAAATTVDEGGSVGLNILTGDVDDNAHLTVTVSGVPSDATLNAGSFVFAPDGTKTYTLGQADLANLTFTAGEEGAVTLHVTAHNTEGSTEADSATTDIVLTVDPVAAAPTALAPATATVSENGTVGISGVVVGPLAEDGDDTVSAALTVGHGTLHVDTTSLPGGVTVTGEDSAALMVSGSAAGVNAVLTSLAFTAADYEGSDTLQVAVTSIDGSNTNPTTAPAATTITGVADTPTITTPAAKTTAENVAVGLTGLSVTEAAGDSGDTINVTLSVAHGSLLVGTHTGLSGSFSGSSITFSGLASAVNAALADNNITYMPTSNFVGSDTLHLTATSTEEAGVGGNTSVATTDHTGAISVIGNTPPSVSISHLLSHSGQQSTFTVHATDASGISSVQLYDGATLIYTFTAAELQAATNGNYVHTFTDGTAPFATINNAVHTISATVIDNANNVATAVDPVTFNTDGGNQNNTKFSAPAGISGEPINLGLTDPTGLQAETTLTITGAPSDWTLNSATHNLDGSWTLVTNDVSSLTVTTPGPYTGALLLNVAETWTNADGSIGNATVVDNVEAYAHSSPIFALSGDDNLTGSSGHDLFVFSQPIGHDVIYNFDATADQIDLVGYAGITGFGDIQAHTANDGAGNAVITLGDGQSITLHGVDATSLNSNDFVFDQTPVTNNSGNMVISDGAIMPLSGTIENTGTITLNSAGSETDLELIEHGITLDGHGQVVLSDSSENFIFGTASDVTLTNVNNTISGAGHLGNGQMALINEGTIIATGTNSLEIGTGTNALTNSGTLEATGSGGLVINSDVANSGLLWANGGNIAVNGDVSGTGSALISGSATLEFGGASSADAKFDFSAIGTLKLDHSADFTGTVSGLASGNQLDLHDIQFGASATESYTANQAGTGGTLTVSDGVHTANIAIQGQYSASGFAMSADNATGTVVTYHDPHFLIT